jgi:hypothetical protein
MLRLLSVAALVFTLFPAAVVLMNACSEPAASTEESSAAQRRFQTNYCYKQYRHQTDVARCLAGSV